jgi:hypothetical protein
LGSIVTTNTVPTPTSPSSPATDDLTNDYLKQWGLVGGSVASLLSSTKPLESIVPITPVKSTRQQEKIISTATSRRGSLPSAMDHKSDSKKLKKNSSPNSPNSPTSPTSPSAPFQSQLSSKGRKLKPLSYESDSGSDKE